MKKIYIYSIGGTLFGLAYTPMKVALGGGWLFVGIAAICILALRIVSERLGK